MKRISSGWKAFAILGASLGVWWPASAQTTYKSIPLDTGGWFSGFSIHSSGRIYGYGDVFGAWRSDNAGQSWSYLNRDFTIDDNFVSGLGVAAGNANAVAFRTSSRLWKSNDGGTTWSIALSNLNDTGLARSATPVMFHPANDNELWLAAGRDNLSGKLWRSLDGGGNWSKIGGATFDSVSTSGVYVRPEFPNQVWVATKSGLFVSANRGVSWTQVWSGGAVRGMVRRADGIGYIVADGGGYRVTASDWANPATYSLTKTVGWWTGWGPSTATVLADGSFVSGGDGDRNPDPNQPQDLRDATRISTDGGQTWQYLPLKLTMPPQPSWSAPLKTGQKADGGRDFIVQDPTSPSRWFMTGGIAPVMTTDAGQTWKYMPNSSGIAGVMTYKVRFARTNSTPAFIPSSDLGAFVVNDGGASGGVSGALHRTLETQMTTHEVMSSDDGQTLVVAGVDQALNKNMIGRSTDGGANWTQLDLTNSGLPASYEGITRAVMAPGNANDYLVLLGAGSLWRTTNGGTSFTAVSGLPAGLNAGSRYHPENSYLETDGVNTGTRYLTVRPNLFFRSTNSGADWSQLAAPFGSDWVHGMAVDRATAGKIWVAGGYRGLKTSSDGGNNWTDITGFNDAMRVDAANGKVAVWGKRGSDAWFKIYYSSDNGANWMEATGSNGRFAFTREIAVDPWISGRIWVSGISINVISGLPGSTTPAPTATPAPVPTATPAPTPTGTPTPTPAPGTGTGTGLKGEYFSTPNFSTLVKTQTDATINFDWASGGPRNPDGTPMSSVGPDNFSVRWTGQIQAMQAGTYTFSVIADDTAKVWINKLSGTPIINQLSYNGGNPTNGTFSMTAGQKYNIKIDFTEAGGGASMKLFWTRPGGTSVIVPTSQLYVPATSTNTN